MTTLVKLDMEAEHMTVTITYEQALRDLVRVLNASHDRRITQATLDFWRGTPDKAGIVISIERTAHGNPISVSACQYVDGKAHKTFTATMPQYRRQGHGERALRAKLEQLAAANVAYRTTVATTNQPSIAMLEKVGLKLARTNISTKADGTPFSQATYVSDVETANERDMVTPTSGHLVFSSGAELLEDIDNGTV